jgi:hypothetical protein
MSELTAEREGKKKKSIDYAKVWAYISKNTPDFVRSIVIIVILLGIYIWVKQNASFFSLNNFLQMFNLSVDQAKGTLTGQGTKLSDSQLQNIALRVNDALNHGGFLENVFFNDDEQGAINAIKQLDSDVAAARVDQIYTQRFQRNIWVDLASELSAEQKTVVNNHLESIGAKARI